MTLLSRYPITVKKYRKAPYDNFEDGDDELTDDDLYGDGVEKDD